MSHKNPKYHGERDSPFFRLQSRAKLAKLLFSGPEKIALLSRGENFYISFRQKKKNGGWRDIDAPRQDLKEIQSRIADLLQRIAPPDFLFAPVVRRSYVDNAAHHRGARSVRLLDIEDFFPSCTANRVVWFFLNRMQCSPDVAAVMRGIVTRNGSLPQGSPCSPILAYLCYVDMWEEINALVLTHDCRLSVYADDLTISGERVSENMIWQIKQCLQRFGHKYNVEKERSRRDKTVEITGVILKRHNLLLPNRQHQKLAMMRRELTTLRSPAAITDVQTRIKGREAQARQIQKYR